jgi:hypothetical protein
MPRFAKDKDGALKVYDQNKGRWRAASNIDTELARQPLLRAASVAAEGATGLPGIGTPGLRQAVEGTAPLTTLGLEAAGIAAGGAGLIGAGVRGVGKKRMAERIAERTRPEGVQGPMQMAPDELGGMIETFGMDSAGAAAQGGFWNDLKQMPGVKGALEGFEEFVGASRPLSGDQAKLLASGRAERLGFEFLPGQRNGNNVMSDIIRSQPFMADALDPLLSKNAANLGSRVARSVGLQGDDLGRNILQDSRRVVGAEFDAVADAIPTVRLGDDIVQQLDDLVLTGKEKGVYGLAKGETDEAGEAIARSLDVEGRDVMKLRQQVAEEASNRAQREGHDKIQRTMTDTVEAIDDVIEQALEASGDEATMKAWKDARTRWRVVRAIDRPGVVTPDGSISMKRLSGALEKEFDKEFRRSLDAPADFPDEVRDMLDYTRLARAFESNLGDSGTATRGALDANTNPVKWGKQRLAAKFIADVILDNPGQAAEMP